MQKILFPMDYMKITTGINEASHAGSNAIDSAGKDLGTENVFAPFTGTIRRIYDYGHTVWLESNEPVEFADGTKDFVVCSFTHDNIVSDLSVGQVIQQGQVFYQEGTAGQARGNHLHLEVGKGKFTGNGWYKNEEGNWVINNSYIPYNAFFLNGTKVINGYGYPWKEANVSEVTKITWQQLAHGILGRNGLSGRTNALDGSSDKSDYIGRELDQALLDELFNSEEARKWRDSNEYGANPNINARLDSIPELQAKIEKLEAELAQGSGKFTKIATTGTDIYIQS